MDQQPNDSKYKLWQGLSEKKLYTKSYDDFEKQFSTEKAVGGLYDALSTRKLYTKTKDDFNNQFFGVKNTIADKKEDISQTSVKKEEPYNFEKSFLYNIGADEWQGSVGRIKPTPMQYMEAEAKKTKPSEAIYKAPTGPRDIKTQADLKESEASFEKFTEKRLRVKGVQFKKGDANYKKEQQLILNDIKNADIFSYIDDNGNIDFARSVGFGKQFLNSFVGSVANVFKATKVNTISDPRELADYANEEEQNQIVEKGSEIATIAGGLPKLVGEVALGTTFGGPTGGASLVASDAYWVGMSEKRLELYYNKRNELIDKGMDKIEAEYKAAASAMEDAPMAAVPTAITNYVLASMGGAGKSITPLSESREAFKKYILQPTKVATLGAVQPLTEYGIESLQGYDVKFKDAVSKMGKGFVDFGLMDLGMHVIMNPGKFAKAVASSAKEYLSNVPKEVIKPMTTKYGEQGQSIISNLESYSKAREKVAPYMPQDLVEHVAGLQEAIDNKTATIKRLVADETTPQSIIATEQQKLQELKNRQQGIIKTGKPNEFEVDEKTGEPVGEVAVIEPKYTQTEEGIAIDKQVKDMGYENVDDAINSVNEALGTKYKTFQEIKPEEFEQVNDIRNHNKAFEETVKGTEYETKEGDIKPSGETTTGTTGEVSAEPPAKIERVESASPEERAAFDEWKSRTFKSESEIDAAYERSRLREYGQSREDFLIGEYCK
jgi:hypothetical protein